LRILVCAKIVPDVEMVLPSDWTGVKNLRQLDIEYVDGIINTYDQSALELALRLKDRARVDGEALEVCVVGVGGGAWEPSFKNTLALKVDRAILVEEGQQLSNRPVATATVIGQAIGLLGHFDLILFGMCSSDYDNAQVGLMTAEALCRPCITHVTEVEMGPGKALITHQTDVGIEVLEIDLPAVLIVGNTDGISLRLPTLKDRLEAGGREVEVLNLKKLGLRPWILRRLDRRISCGTCVRLNRRKCEMIAGDTPQEKAAALVARIRDMGKDRVI
jgi:electron transfer flavoprotein beta subunit